MTLMGTATLDSRGDGARIIRSTVPSTADGFEARAIVRQSDDVTISYRHDGTLASAYNGEHLHDTRLDGVDEITVAVSSDGYETSHVTVYAEWTQDEE